MVGSSQRVLHAGSRWFSLLSMVTQPTLASAFLKLFLKRSWSILSSLTLLSSQIQIQNLPRSLWDLLRDNLFPRSHSKSNCGFLQTKDLHTANNPAFFWVPSWSAFAPFPFLFRLEHVRDASLSSGVFYKHLFLLIPTDEFSCSLSRASDHCRAQIESSSETTTAMGHGSDIIEIAAWCC